MSRSRNWCFTLHTSDDVSHEDHWDPSTIDWESGKPSTKYIICGLEVCPKTGRLHWQGYIEYSNAVSLTSAKNAFDCNRVHLEVRRGSRRQAITYCTKLDTAALSEDEEPRFDPEGDTTGLGRTKTIFSWGEDQPSKVDDVYDEVLHKEDYGAALDYVKTKRPRDFVLHGAAIERNLGIHYSKIPGNDGGARRYILPYFGAALLGTKGILLLGKAGAGKTRFAMDHFKHPLLVRHTDALKRIKIDCKYDGIVFDDFSVSHWPISAVIHLLDIEMETQINVKHGMVCIPAGMPRIFTSNKLFDEWVCPNTNAEEMNAIRRRIEVHVISCDIRLLQ